MIQGVVTAELEATIRLIVRGPLAQAEVEAVIDTGSNDFLTLPPPTVTALGLTFAAPAEAMLADGRVITMHYHRASVEWDCVFQSVLVLAADGGPLAGMSLLRGYDLFIEAVGGGIVIVSKRT